jgi:serine/threonine protein kinase
MTSFRDVKIFKVIRNMIEHFHLSWPKTCFAYKFLRKGSIEFNHFNVVKLIGLGAFGKVYLCEHKLTGETVVIKAIKKLFVTNCKHENLIRQENQVLRVLSRCPCPFILKTLATFQDSSMLYIITEFVSGGELAYQLEVAPHQKFSEGRARFYVAELLVAIEYLHTKEQIVYRDIKLENIVLDKKGHIKLIDYGFSKKLFKGEKTYTCCGTTEYLAPEVIFFTNVNILILKKKKKTLLKLINFRLLWESATALKLMCGA